MERKTESISKNRYLEAMDETHQLLKEYYRHLADLGVETAERGTRIQHAKWMCLQAQSLPDVGRANRWLGFIQGVLWTENVFDLSELREHSKYGEINERK